MIEMKYSKNRVIELLQQGYYCGFKYYILNLGTHPTAYIEIDDKNKYYKNEDIELNVHGGITYYRDYLWISEQKEKKGWFIGWDYGHYGDYSGYEEMYPVEFRTRGKKWTTKEIEEEVKEACEELAQKSKGE